MTQQTRLEALADAIGTDVKTILTALADIPEPNVTIFPTGSEPDYSNIEGPQLWVEYTP